MRYNGELVEWNDARGFGFARIPGSNERIFVHIKAFEDRSLRPTLGERFTFERGMGDRGPVAKRVRRSNAAAARRPAYGTPKRRFAIDWLLGIALTALQLWAIHTAALPAWKWAVLPVASLIAFIAFNLDKGYARREARRISEASLLAMSIPGWLGALAAQQLFRHKSSKTGFYYPFRAIALIQGAAIAWFVFGAA